MTGTPPHATIVVVEDETTIADAVARRLRAEGFAVEVAYDGPSGVALCERIRPDLVVLDLMLPGMDGLEVCRRIQRERPVPVLMLTARDDETDVLTGLGVGADDYVTKPFSVRELVGRVRAILRRVERERSRPANDAHDVIEVGRLRIDPGRRTVAVEGELVELSVTEFELLHALARSPGIVRHRDDLLEHVWGYPAGSPTRTLDSHVAQVRRKIGAHRIRTVHGVGYALTDPPDGTGSSS